MRWSPSSTGSHARMRRAGLKCCTSETWPCRCCISHGFPVYRYNAGEGSTAKLLRESTAVGMARLELPVAGAGFLSERDVVMKGGASLKGRVLIDRETLRGGETFHAATALGHVRAG